MPKQSERFKWLAHEFDILAQSLENCPETEKRKQLLRRMKILIDEIDKQILFNLKRDTEDTPNLPQSTQVGLEP
jgi:hypothetical protein